VILKPDLSGQSHRHIEKNLESFPYASQSAPTFEGWKVNRKISDFRMRQTCKQRGVSGRWVAQEALAETPIAYTFGPR
jgi:hypothetical protein